MTRKIFLSILFVAVAASFVTAQATPDATVRAFYAYSNARSSAFNRRHVELRKKWYTPELYAAMVKQLEEDEKYLKTHPTDKPFFGDGLTFRPLDEPCEVGDRSYKRVQSVLRSQMTRSRSEVDVKFAYPSACTTGGEPIIYTVILHKVGARWLINDLKYDDGSTLLSEIRKDNYN